MGHISKFSTSGGWEQLTERLPNWTKNIHQGAESELDALNQIFSAAPSLPLPKYFVSRFGRCTDKSTQYPINSSPQIFGFIEIADNQTPSLRPTRTRRFFQGSHQLRKCLYFLSSISSHLCLLLNCF